MMTLEWLDADSPQVSPATLHLQDIVRDRELLLGLRDHAIRYLSTAVRIKPDHFDARNNPGAILARLGRRPEAMIHFHPVLRILAGP